jgi:hypothetical protein
MTVGKRPGGRGPRGKKLYVRQARQEAHSWMRRFGIPTDTAIADVSPSWRTRRVKRDA